MTGLWLRLNQKAGVCDKMINQIRMLLAEAFLMWAESLAPDSNEGIRMKKMILYYFTVAAEDMADDT